MRAMAYGSHDIRAARRALSAGTRHDCQALLHTALYLSLTQLLDRMSMQRCQCVAVDI